MVDAGFSSQFELDAEITTPVVRFSVEGPDPANVNATMAELRSRFNDSVQQAQFQEGTAENQVAHLLEIQSISAAPVTGDRRRAAAGIVLVGVLLTALARQEIGRKFPGSTDGGRSSESSERPGRAGVVQHVLGGIST